MKYLKRTVTLCMALLIVVLFMAPAASAVSSAAWRQLFSGFLKLDLTYENTHSYYTVVLQECLWFFDKRYENEIDKAGGIDGKYGPGTKKAVELFQADKSLTADGICGRDTWSNVAAGLNCTENGTGYAFFDVDGIYVIRATNTSPYQFEYYGTRFDGEPLLILFHSATSIY